MSQLSWSGRCAKLAWKAQRSLAGEKANQLPWNHAFFGMPRGIKSGSGKQRRVLASPSAATIPPMAVLEETERAARWHQAITVDYPPVEYVKLENGMCRGDEVILDHAGWVPEEWMRWTGEPQKAVYFHKPFSSPIQPIKGSVVSLATPSHSNYSHWTYDSLPQLGFALEQGLRVDAIYFASTQPFQSEILRLLGWDKFPVIDASTHPVVRPETLHYFTHKTFLPPSPAVIRWLKSFYVPAILAHQNSLPASLSAPRLYLSRRGVKGRELVNEEEVEQLFKTYGFTIVQPHQLTVREQSAYFHQAEIIAGPHASSFTNLIFARPGTKIFELLSIKHPDATFRRLAHFFDCDYDGLFSEGEHDAAAEYWQANRSAMTICLQKLEKSLQQILSRTRA